MKLYRATQQSRFSKLSETTTIGRHAYLFRKDEEGSMVILTLFIFIFMLAMAGLGIDSMRHEMNRAHLQATLDSAVLAGAGSSTEAEAKAIVEDYFEKADMSEYLNAIGEDDIEMTLNSAKVTASAGMEMDTYLMKLSGVTTLSTSAEATAQTRIPKLEIALVLDVSNSMNSNGKIGNLRTAAKQFVTTIMDSVDPGNAVISIVPFSTSVAPSQEIYDALSVNETHEHSNCLFFTDDDYNDTALVTDLAAEDDLTLEPMTQAIYTSRYGNFESLNQSWRSCYTEDGYRIVPFSASKTDLHTKIDAMIADGNTTGSLGVKWGAALLDPTFRDVTAELISSNHMDSSLSAVPVDYTEPDTMKVIVMMGDGMNTTTYFFGENSAYRGKNSDLFHMKYQDEVFEYAYYIYNSNYRWYGSHNEWRCSQWYAECIYRDEEKSAFYMRDPDSTWNAGTLTSEGDGLDVTPRAFCTNPAGNGLEEPVVGCDDVLVDEALDDYWYYDIDNGEWIDGSTFVALDDDLSGFIHRERLNWEEAWGFMSPDEYGDITGIYLADDEYVDDHNVNGSTKDQRMSNVCGAAKGKGVVIYTIGYEITAGGTAEQSLKDCASGYDPNANDTSYYYRVEGVDITDAFGSIAGNVQSLRLTQ
ncbi:MAG: Tad domain-containing protein [Pseudomonadota bacterium]